MNSPISYSKLLNITGTNAERIAFIDFKLRFTGIVKRSDLHEAFGMSDATASRVISKYNELRNNNLIYDRNKKVNSIQLDTYEPLILLDAEVALGMLAHGFNKNKLSDNPVLPYARIGSVPNLLDVNEISKITRAIFGGYAIKCDYISNSSDNHNARTLLPLGILFDGRNWIFRAYDRSDKIRADKFKNFNFSRATSVEKVSSDEGERLGYEELSEDVKWNLSTSLFLALHPMLGPDDEKAVRKDFGMKPDQNELIVTERAALLWIMTKQWNIDTGDTVDGKYYKFILKNKDMIKPYL